MRYCVADTDEVVGSRCSEFDVLGARALTLLSLCWATGIAGCTQHDLYDGIIYLDMSERRLEREFGVPDVISITQGDLTVFYLPGDPCGWPEKGATVCYYYLSQNIRVLIRENRVLDVSAIPETDLQVLGTYVDSSDP